MPDALDIPGLTPDSQQDPAAESQQGEQAESRLPVARVLIDAPLPQLDRLFDYSIPPRFDDAAQVGTRVTVRFGARRMHGWIWERSTHTDFPGPLTPLRSVVSDLVVAPAATRRLVEAVAERGAGCRADVMRLAIPPRHVRAEERERERSPESPLRLPLPDASTWEPYAGGVEMLAHLRDGHRPVRIGWCALPDGGDDLAWVPPIATAVQTVLAQGKRAIVVVATAALAQRVAARIGDLLDEASPTQHPSERIGVLCAEDGPSPRYRVFTRALLGGLDVVVGTRAAAYAPLDNCGLICVWDDGDPSLAELRAPYTHTRTVASLRSAHEGCALILGGWSRSIETQALVESGWAVDIHAPLSTIRQRAPRVNIPDEEDLGWEGSSGMMRIPSAVFRAIRTALEKGPVLVQVPRGGYAALLSCSVCREVAQCEQCSGPLEMLPDHSLRCRWCNTTTHTWSCPDCDNQQVRMISLGVGRTAEELQRAFPQTTVISSGTREAHGIIDDVDARPQIVVSTPGAEPIPSAGYQLAVALDAARLSARPELGAASEALRRWMGIGALCAPGGRLMVLGGVDTAVAQAMLRWDPVTFASRQLAERRELHLPPAWRTARLDADQATLEGVIPSLREQDIEVMGPVPLEDDSRLLARVPAHRGRELAHVMREMVRERATDRQPQIHVTMEPTVLW